jgi:hypothetical protein
VGGSDHRIQAHLSFGHDLSCSLSYKYLEHNRTQAQSNFLSEITMKSFLFTITLAMLVYGASASAQSAAKPEDSSAVQATVRNYIEGYYRGDASRMQSSLDAHYLKHMIHGSIPIREKTGAQMIEEVRSHGAADFPEAQKTEQISVLDISGNIASAKLVTPHWVDYMTLSKTGGNWKILSVVQQIED